MKSFFAIAVLPLLCFSCINDKYYRTKTGLLYKVIPGPVKGDSSFARMGCTVKVNYIQKVGDTVIESTYERMPLYYMVLPGMSAYNPLEVFDYGINEGDSVVTVQRIDSMIKKNIFKKAAPWMKNDDEWITTMKVEKIFRGNDSLLQVDKQNETKRVTALQTALGKERIAGYLKKNDLKASASEELYIEIVQQGSGMKADTGKWVSADFVVKTLKGKMVNSTLDTSFHMTGPKGFVMGAHFFPPMIEERLKQFNQGSIVRFYIPGVLLFGVEPQSKETKIDDDMIFEVQLKNVLDQAPVPVK
ncbi:MAG TPA: FKBP-type peptidyl-prolyl cis-trans isomerase [Chitinophagaceae bacterium]|nr:FKBP-type peptidyl-prolyl cis-trans isomerase [Chitinophagaceae bacterium]